MNLALRATKATKLDREVFVSYFFEFTNFPEFFYY